MLDKFHRLRQEAMNRFYKYGEPALTIGSSAIAEPVSGLAGIGSLLSGKSASDAALAIAQAQAAMTYQPRTPQGMQGLQGFQQVMHPIGEVIQGASQNLGDKAYSATGSPLAGAIGYSLPTAMLEGLGLKGLNIARKPVSGADLYSARMGAGAVDGSDLFNKLVELYPSNVDQQGRLVISDASSKTIFKPDGTVDIIGGGFKDTLRGKDFERFAGKQIKAAQKAVEVNPSISELSKSMYSGRKTFFKQDGSFDLDGYRKALADAENSLTDDLFNEYQSGEWKDVAAAPLSAQDKKSLVAIVKGKTLYHGSPVDFDDIDVPDDGGAFLTSSIPSAEHYADGGNVYKYKITPKKPLIVKSTDLTYDIDYSSELKSLKNQGYDSIITLDDGDYVVLDKSILKKVK